MKKKIVYISGSDVFDVNDVRAAFDEVRSMLHLDSDTILFGVPVDEESAMPESADAVTESVAEDNAPIEQKSDYNTDFNMEYDQEPEPVVEDVQFCDEEPTEEMATKEVIVANSNDTEEIAPVVPIQSVLKASETKKAKGTSTRKKKTAKVEQEETVAESEPKVEMVAVAETEIVAQAIDSSEPTKESDEPAQETIAVQDEEIEDMINDDMPTEPKEKTLEELLESMTPLREDVHTDATTDTQPVEEIDATLESLASEFVDTQTAIPTGKKGTGRGRIGKLKSVLLPFSSKRKDDTGLMGDLFGWAGVAANDDDFTIPGFFTNAAGKK